MFVGHEFLAFALGVGLARLAGTDEDTALAIGLLAGASALLPDLDLLVGAISYASLLAGPAAASWDSLWGVANGIHRGVSHTLVGGIGTAVVLTATVAGRRRFRRAEAWPALVALAVGVGTVAGLLLFAAGAGTAEVLSMGLVAVGAAIVGSVVATRTALSPLAVLGGATVGVLSHPFGDLFMAAPPQFLYPVAHVLPTQTVRLAADPTLNLLAITGVELTAVWLGVLAFASVTRTDLGSAIDPRAAIGLGYPLLMAFVPRPTMADAHWLGFTIAPFAVVGPLTVGGTAAWTRDRVARAVVTGLATITVAAVAYAVTYLVLFSR